MKKLLIALLLASPCYAGQSLQVSTQTATNTSVAGITAGTSYTWEWSFHDWDANADNATHTLFPDFISNSVFFYNFGSGDIRLDFSDTREVGGSDFQMPLASLTTRFATVRFIHDMTNKADTVQAWDINGTLFYNVTQTFTSMSGSYGTGMSFAGSGTNKSMAHAYFRVYNYAFATNAKAPATADTATNTVVYYKFDGGNNTGTLADISGNAYTLSISGGSPIYVATPGQTLIVPLIETNPHPLWGPIISWRAGYPAGLDCRDSLAQADNGNTPTCSWSILSGPSTPTINSTTLSTPTLTGLIFGDYAVQLTATINATSSTTVTHIGAVATDDNFVVVNASTNTDVIFGPMIAWGHNPWGYEDERHYTGSYVNNYNANTLFPWLTTGQGTISYTFAGLGLGSSLGGTGTTTTVPVTSTMTAIPIADKTKLDFSTFPTRVTILNGGGSPEEIRVCSKTDGAGNTTTLNVCYDGRATSAYLIGPNFYSWTNTPQNFTSGATVGQAKVTGTSTLFLTDSQRAICPGGAGYPGGSVLFSTGAVTMLVSSNVIVGSGITWTSSIVNDFIVVAASHSGSAFNFVASITSVQDATHATLSRVYPSDATNGTYTYKILNTDRISVLEYTKTNGATGRKYAATTGCESETALYTEPASDVPAYDGTLFSGQKYSYITALGAQSPFGPNFYGAGLAHRALYFRSGLARPKQQADIMDENWPRSPEIDGSGSGSPLLWGGGMIGGMVDLITNPSTILTWNDLRGYPANGDSVGASQCNDYDTRDSGYIMSGPALAYMFDPDTGTYHNEWAASVRSIIARDTSTVQAVTGAAGCKTADNSWSNTANYFSLAGPSVNVTAGTTTVTAHGTTFSSSLCYSVAYGTMGVTNGSYIVTGGSFPATSYYAQMAINGTRSGQPFTQWLNYTYFSSTSAFLSGKWLGDTGTANYILKDDPRGLGMNALATGLNDPLLLKNYSCRYVDSTHIVLDRPWEGSTDTTGAVHWGDSITHLGGGNMGYGEQPYMLGIRLHFMDWLKSAPDSDIRNMEISLSSSAATWMHDTAYETDSHAMSYGRVFQGCEPTVASGYPQFTGTFKNGGNCQTGIDTTAVIPNQRELNAEGFSALKAYDDAQGHTAASIAWGDEAYGAVYGKCAWTDSGYPCDASYSGSTTNLTDAYLAAFKYLGFFFGMGMSHQWPAIRVGGVHAAIPATAAVPFTIGGSTTSVRMTVTEPNAVVLPSVTCTTSPCTVSGDKRQGTHLLQTDYLNVGGTTLSSTVTLLDFTSSTSSTTVHGTIKGGTSFKGNVTLR